MPLALTLAGCTYHYNLKVVEWNGKVAFVPEKDKGTGCISEFKVTNDAGEVIWELEAGQYLSPPCDSKFPILYASVPRGMIETVKAQPLLAGVLYKVEGWDGDSYSGGFRVHKGTVVENVQTR